MYITHFGNVPSIRGVLFLLRVAPFTNLKKNSKIIRGKQETNLDPNVMQLLMIIQQSVFNDELYKFLVSVLSCY